MSNLKNEEGLNKILNAIINSSAGIKYAIIIDDTGITLASQAKFTITEEDSISAEKIGAISGAVFTAGEEQGLILGYGKINFQIMEFDKGLLFLIKVGMGVLCLATDLNVQIGFIKGTLKKWAPKIHAILKEYLKSEQKTVSNELKELFNTDTFGF